ncbi:MAG TPA: FUSC family protein, partial [Polyangiales bacterium]|nr:FUSC family protein [Polyangiales bacterium]
MALQFSPVRRSFLVRETLRIAPARPNLPAGLRAGLATTLPLLLAPLIHHRPELAWTGLAGFSIVLVDKGGPYRTRADCMLLMTATGSLALALGTLGAPHSALALVLLAIVVFIGGFMRLFGAEASAVGVVTSVTLVVALSRSAHGFGDLLASVSFYLLGSLWAMLISLLLWPLRQYRPARYAVGTALRKLATVASSFVGAHASPSEQIARRTQLGAAREAIENARAAIAASRRGRPGPTRLGEQLLALLEASDQLFATLVALEDGLAAELPDALPKLPGWIDREATLIAVELARIADALESERVLTETNDAAARQLANSIAPPAQAQQEYVLRILSRALERLDGVVEIARAIDDPSATLPSGRTEPSELSSEASKRSLLHDNWTLDSAMFRHALRMAITTASVLLIVRALALDHGYWATLTCLVIMQPHGAATWTKALQRVLGTLLGAGVATVVASYVHDPIAIGGFVFAFVAIGMTLLPLNYGVFAVFLTPGFVLLAETGAGRLDLAGVRVSNTLLGAVIALLGSRLLFPVRERDQFRPLIVDAVAALESLLSVAASPQPSAAALRAARRKIGLALLNAEASYQRLLTETGLGAVESEALLTLL